MTVIGEVHRGSFAHDPKHLGFVLARYHFVARELYGRGHVLEVGCGDGTGARVVRPVVGKLVGVDKVPMFSGSEPFDAFLHHDMTRGRVRGSWDGIYALDVLEHVHPFYEAAFLRNMTASLAPHGAVIIGSPSLESQPYASTASRREHVNCKDETAFRRTLLDYFHNVFVFGMNDMTLHTGFGPMCHYRLAICTDVRGTVDSDTAELTGAA